MPATVKSEAQMTVFYDGSCPLCRREIDFYRERAGTEAVVWADVSQPDSGVLPDNLSLDDALRRFHVETRTGHLLSGAAAFAHLWAEMPRFRLLGRTSKVWPLSLALEAIYLVFLRVRPVLRRFFPKR